MQTSVTRDPILEAFETAAKPPTTVQELVSLLREFAQKLDREKVGAGAASVLLEGLAGRTGEWHDALDNAYQEASL